MGHDRHELVRLFADLEFAPFGLTDWAGDVGVADWTAGEHGRIESITLAYRRGDRERVTVTTARDEPAFDSRFGLGLSVNGRVCRFRAVGGDGTWSALLAGDRRGPSVLVAARGVRPTAIRLERVAASRPYIDGSIPD